MERYSYIFKNEVYITHINSIEEYERDRIFCHHDTGHFLDVARIGMIINLSEGIGIKKDVIYAAALLHDIGRDIQYKDGTPHEIASRDIAEKILSDSEYTLDERLEILRAIANHRSKEIMTEVNLSGVLYRADKLSRACYFCKAEKECDWKNDKKNLELNI